MLHVSCEVIRPPLPYIIAETKALGTRMRIHIDFFEFNPKKLQNTDVKKEKRDTSLNYSLYLTIIKGETTPGAPKPIKQPLTAANGCSGRI